MFDFIRDEDLDDNPSDESEAAAMKWYDPTVDDSWYMAGTERTGQYVELARNSVGRVGFRLIGGQVRVRIEPTSESAAQSLAKAFPRSGGWKQPGDDGQPRYSKVCGRLEAMVVVQRAIRALNRREKVERQPGKRLWRKQLIVS